MHRTSVRPRRRPRSTFGFFLGGAAGAALMYFFDPDSGNRRRAVARDRSRAMERKAARDLGNKADYYAGKAEGIAHAVRPGTASPVSDATLKHKIESEVLRNYDASSVNVNVDDGVVELRGILPRGEDIRRVEEEVRKMTGVADVRTRLHLPKTPVPPSV